MIYRGTTTTQYFRFPYVWADVDKIYITYFQNGSKVLEKNKDAISYDEDEGCIYVNLSQMDTLAFHKCGIPADLNRSLIYIQIRVLMTNKVSYSCDPIKDRICDALNDDYMAGSTTSEDTVIYNGGTI